MSPDSPEKFFLHILHFIFFHHRQRVCIPGNRPCETTNASQGGTTGREQRLVGCLSVSSHVGGAWQHQLQQEAETEKRMFVCLYRKEHERCRREAGYEQQQRRFQGDR